MERDRACAERKRELNLCEVQSHCTEAEIATIPCPARPPMPSTFQRCWCRFVSVWYCFSFFLFECLAMGRLHFCFPAAQIFAGVCVDPRIFPLAADRSLRVFNPSGSAMHSSLRPSRSPVPYLFSDRSSCVQFFLAHSSLVAVAFGFAFVSMPSCVHWLYTQIRTHTPNCSGVGGGMVLRLLTVL